MSTWPFGDLCPLSYGVILIDPPWKQEFHSQETGTKKAPQAHYDCMPLDAIKALPVGHLAAPDCFIVMWSMWNFVAPGFATDVLRAWGFEPKSGGSWQKMTRHGKQAFGTGYGFRGSCEPFLTGAMGRPQIRSRSERNGIVAEAREHSRKPDAMHEALERMFPDVRRCELFAREDRPGWDCWGDELGKFPAKGAA